jgi:hypothetical protein
LCSCAPLAANGARLELLDRHSMWNKSSLRNEYPRQVE